MTARWARGGEGRQGGGRSPLNPPQLRGRPGGSSPTTCWPRPHPCTPQSYLRNFWYAAALSSNVTDDKPLGVDILGGRITLFRDQETGEVRACTQPASSSRALHDLAPLRCPATKLAPCNTPTACRVCSPCSPCRSSASMTGARTAARRCRAAKSRWSPAPATPASCAPTSEHHAVILLSITMLHRGWKATARLDPELRAGPAAGGL